MSVRRWQIPAAVAAVACELRPDSSIERERYRDLADQVPVGSDTLFALVASGQSGSDVPSGIIDWAQRLYSQSVAASTAASAETLVAAGFDPNGLAPEAYGILDPAYEGERICAVVRASADPGCAVDRWGPDGWEPVVGASPVGLPYATLSGEVLADALDAVTAGASLILSPSQPRGFVTTRGEPAMVAAADVTSEPVGGVYAVTDPLDTSAVVVLFAAAPGPSIRVRRGGEWVPDDGTLLGQLRSINPPPVISVSPDQVPAVCRQVDDFDATHPQTASHPTGGMTPQAKATPVAAAASQDPLDHSKDVMIALPVPASTARGLASHDGVTEDPADMHVTLAYLGETDRCPPQEQLLNTVRNWAAGVPMLKGQVAGGGMFTANDSGPVAVALPDLPDLPRHRQRLVDMLRTSGVSQVDTEHGYTPHITLAYNAAQQIQPHNLALNFPRVGLYYGNETTFVPFGWQGTDTDLTEPLVASPHTSAAARDAHGTDVAFDRRRAEADLAEQTRRREFEERLGRRYDELCSEGVEPDVAAGTVRREMQAEDDRRALWERDRSDALAAEKARRLGVHEGLVPELPIAADAAPHTAMPRQLVDYWTKGEGAAKIRWGTSGDFMRAVRYLAKYMDLYRAKAAANELHKIATGIWPATHAKLDRKVEGRK